MRLFFLSITFIYLLVLPSCSITKKQAQTISPEASSFIKKNNAIRIPIVPLTEKLTIPVRKKRDALNEPLLSKYVRETELSITYDTIAAVPVLVIRPKTVLFPEAVAVYIHGGAFLLGSAYDITALQMANKLGVKVISLSYSLSPKAKFPVAVNELLKAYEAITKIYSPKKTVVFGVSAGGNLVLSTLLKARDNNLPLPAAVGLFTPWADLNGAGDSYRANEKRDPVIGWKNQLDKAVKAYVAKPLLHEPYVSPVYADYAKGFPPTLITTGTRDLFLSDCVRLYWKMKNENVPVELRVWEGMWHAFNVVPNLPEGEKCLDEMAGFLNGYLK